ncbi:6-bladed beta-propeller [Mycobacterium shinjukuense]|uniref:Uncharacterized protein n=2 Tax=Mycobacterium shinjukuense TaxID=398694 RepID=A0A7I7MSB2_9MYCO|nr:6-bladed beta-propeller [Mycobacterium shinjukuense]ORB65960.1 hypothetical protein BST45_14305 [Mycobacterium shinjukuense]BBX74692.1 hypothetical protein MSHI_25980 [Mycobacterium shinjukuense]
MARGLALGIAVWLCLTSVATAAPAPADTPTNFLPNPYRTIANWGELPDGRTWGTTSAVAIGPDGATVWVAERCGETRTPDQIALGAPFACAGSTLDPILKFDTNGKLLGSFGAGMIVFPHAIHVDRDGNVWVADGLGYGGKGQQVLKFSPAGQLLLALGKAGTPGGGEDEFNSPSAVVTAPNGDIFVADGHGGNTNARIVKFDKTGKFIKQWGHKGSGPGEFDTPHTIAMDSAGRLFVGDRNNNRIQIFDQDGQFLNVWTQFSRPSGIYINNGIIYVTDSESESLATDHNGWKRGIRIGSVADGSVWALIPDPIDYATNTSGAEGLAVDAAGNIFGAEVGQHRMMKYVRESPP